MWAQVAFSRSTLFQGFLNGLFELPDQDSLIGVTVNFHPLWWRLATLWQETGVDDDRDMPDLAWLGWLTGIGPGWSLAPRPDPTWRSAYWSRACNDRKKRDDPFLIKLCIRTGAGEDSRRRFSEFARAQPFWCTTEERPMAIAAASLEGGRNITANAPGTVGGFLKDKNTGQIYGLTCGHVGQSRGTSVMIEDQTGVKRNNAGAVEKSTYSSLKPLPAGSPCNRAAAITKNVDAALIEISGGHTALDTVKQIGTIDAIFDRTQFGAGDAVEMCGAVSGHNHYFVGAYDVVYKVRFSNGQIHCFEHMFEISRQALTSQLVPPVLAAKAVQGDSGAFVCRTSPSGNYAYCGTLVAVDGTNGYACFAEAVRDWAAGLSPAIDLVPL